MLLFKFLILRIVSRKKENIQNQPNYNYFFSTAVRFIEHIFIYKFYTIRYTLQAATVRPLVAKCHVRPPQMHGSAYRASWVHSAAGSNAPGKSVGDNSTPTGAALARQWRFALGAATLCGTFGYVPRVGFVKQLHRPGSFLQGHRYIVTARLCAIALRGYMYKGGQRTIVRRGESERGKPWGRVTKQKTPLQNGAMQNVISNTHFASGRIANFDIC